MWLTCDHARRLFDAKLDGDLTGTLLFELEAHLLECPTCRRSYQAQLAVGEIIRHDVCEPLIRDDLADLVLSRAKLPEPTFAHTASFTQAAAEVPSADAELELILTREASDPRHSAGRSGRSFRWAAPLRRIALLARGGTSRRRARRSHQAWGTGRQLASASFAGVATLTCLVTLLPSNPQSAHSGMVAGISAIPTRSSSDSFVSAATPLAHLPTITVQVTPIRSSRLAYVQAKAADPAALVGQTHKAIDNMQATGNTLIQLVNLGAELSRPQPSPHRSQRGDEFPIGGRPGATLGAPMPSVPFNTGPFRFADDEALY